MLTHTHTHTFSLEFLCSASKFSTTENIFCYDFYFLSSSVHVFSTSAHLEVLCTFITCFRSLWVPFKNKLHPVVNAYLYFQIYCKIFKMILYPYFLCGKNSVQPSFFLKISSFWYLCWNLHRRITKTDAAAVL